MDPCGMPKMILIHELKLYGPFETYHLDNYKLTSDIDGQIHMHGVWLLGGRAIGSQKLWINQ